MASKDFINDIFQEINSTDRVLYEDDKLSLSCILKKHKDTDITCVTETLYDGSKNINIFIRESLDFNFAFRFSRHYTMNQQIKMYHKYNSFPQEKKDLVKKICKFEKTANLIYSMNLIFFIDYLEKKNISAFNNVCDELYTRTESVVFNNTVAEFNISLNDFSDISLGFEASKNFEENSIMFNLFIDTLNKFYTIQQLRRT